MLLRFICLYFSSVAPIGTPIIEFHENPTNGDKVTFTCNTKGVKGNPKMSFVKWYGDDELDWVSKECCTYTLRVNLNSSGDYSCLVGNTYGSTPKSDGKFLNVSATGKYIFMNGIIKYI